MSNAGQRKNAALTAGAAILTAQSACPIATGGVGFWVNDSNVPQLRLTGGTDVDLSAGGLPDQTSNSGKFLTTNGTIASWATVTVPSLGNFAFSANSVDLSGSAGMTIGGANTSALDLKVGSVKRLENTATGIRMNLSANRLKIDESGTSESESSLYSHDQNSRVYINNTYAQLKTASAAILISDGIAMSGSKMGFYGTAAITKPTGVTVDAAGIHAALVSLGLIAA